jgi:regulator of replication initiation timing
MGEALNFLEQIAELEQQIRDLKQDLADVSKDYRGVRMELELERGRVKSLKATVVNQAEQIAHLSALNTADHNDRVISSARDDNNFFEDDFIEL